MLLTPGLIWMAAEARHQELLRTAENNRTHRPTR